MERMFIFNRGGWKEISDEKESKPLLEPTQLLFALPS